MKKITIKFSTPEDIANFINVCSKYSEDINVYDGHIMVDAKSLVGMFSLPIKKDLEVEIVSDDKDKIRIFVNEIRKFGDM